MKSKILLTRLIHIFPGLATLLFISLPLALSQRDMWDGAIVRSGILLGNLEGWRIVASESGWDTIHLLATSKQFISNLLGVNYELIHATFVTLCLLIIVYSTGALLRKVFTFSATQSYFVAALVPIIPIWNVTLSSGMDAQIGYLAIGLWGTQEFLGSTKWSRWLGLAAIVISYEYSSLVLFIPAITLISVTRKSQINLKALMPLFLTTSLAVMYFVIQKTFFPPYGRYSSYNTFVIDGWQQRLSDFSTFLLVDTAGFLIALVTFLTLREKEEKVSYLKQFLFVTAYSLILFLSSCLPHVFVGKSVSLFKIDDWEGRYALSLAIALAISFGLFLNLSLRHQNQIVTTIQLIITVPLIGGLAWLSIYGFAYKLNQQLFFREFIASLQKFPDKVPPGLVEISANGVPGPDIRTYEYNVLFQEAYGGNPNWYVGNELPLWPQNQQNYYFMDVYIPHEQSCITKMEITAEGFIGNKAIFGNILPIGTKGTVSVAIQDIDCNGN